VTPAALLASAILAMTLTAAHAGDAAETVRGFYTDVEFEADPGFRDRFVDPARAKFDENDKLSSNGEEVGCIDFVLAIDAQDYDEKVLAKTLEISEQVEADSATVDAKFSLFEDQPDSKREIIWSLKDVDGAWKVSDIESKTSDWKLSKFECKSDN
jgi:hypothetical protein